MCQRFAVTTCATCVLALVGVPGGCLPGPADQPAANDSSLVRVATYNTQCIVPEMDESTLAKISSVADDVVNCLDDVAGFLSDPAKLALIGIDAINPFDFRDEAVDRVMQRAKDIADYIKEHPQYATACDLQAYAQPEPPLPYWRTIRSLLDEAAAAVCQQQTEPSPALAAADVAADRLLAK